MKTITLSLVLFFLLLSSEKIRIDKIESKKTMTIGSVRLSNFSEKLGLFNQPTWPKEKKQITIFAQNQAILIEFEIKTGQNYSPFTDSYFNQSPSMPAGHSFNIKERTPP